MSRSVVVAFSLVTALTVSTAAFAQSAATQPAASGGPMFPRVKFETTLGDFVLELNGEKAPVSTENFLKYCEDGHYTGTIFHRVMKDFMIQGGGYLPDLSEKSRGLRDPIKNEWQNGLKNERGTISMARTSEPDSATAQFFINVVNNTQGSMHDLDSPRGGAAYAVFGKVVEGMDIIDKIRNTAVREDPRLGGMGAVVPVETVIVKSAKLVGTCDRTKIASAAAERGKMAPIPAWKKKITEVRRAYADCQQAQTALQNCAPDKKDAAQKEYDRLLAEAKADEAELMKVAAEDAEREIVDYIARMEKESGKKYEKTTSGLRFTILTPGNGASPKPTDTVEVHYTGWLLDGTKFDSSVDRGSPATFPLNGVIKGWTEGVGLMKVGEKRKLVIPPELAYHFRPPTPAIPLNAPLVFDVELLSIK